MRQARDSQEEHRSSLVKSKEKYADPLRQLSASIHQCRMAFWYKMVPEMQKVPQCNFLPFPLLSPLSTSASTENQNSEPKTCLGRHCRRDLPTAAGTKALTTPGTPTWARRAVTAPPPASALMQQGAKE